LRANAGRKFCKQLATNLQTGYRAGNIIANPSLSLCWHKARFLALRAELVEGWQPRNSVERLLIDTLVQTQTEYERWLEILVSRTTLQAVYEGKDEGRWTPPRVTDSDAIEQAAAMVERFHRLIIAVDFQERPVFQENLRQRPQTEGGADRFSFGHPVRAIEPIQKHRVMPDAQHVQVDSLFDHI
jgi:hypothetical protein